MLLQVHPFAIAAVLLTGTAAGKKSGKDPYMVPGTPEYVFGTYTMCAVFNAKFRCEDGDANGDQCSSTNFVQQTKNSPRTSPYLIVGQAFANITSPPADFETSTNNLPGLKMRRFVSPYTPPGPNPPTIDSETLYVGTLEADPFTRKPQIKARFEQVYVNQTGIGYDETFGTDLYLDCKFPRSEKQSKKDGWDMVCIGNFDNTVFPEDPGGQNMISNKTSVQSVQQLFYVKGVDSTACDGVPPSITA